MFFFFVQQITARVSILVPSRPACVWKGPGAQSPDLLSVQPLCRVAEREGQVSRRTNRVYCLVRFSCFVLAEGTLWVLIRGT